MAINKTVNKSTKSHVAMRNCIEYVLKDAKVADGYCYMTGPSPDAITWEPLVYMLAIISGRAIMIVILIIYL